MENISPNSEKITSQIKDDFFKLLPLIPIWLTILGSAKLHYYYRPYKVNIFNYLDFQDILLLFINDFYTILISFAALSFIQFISYHKEPNNFETYFQSPKWWENMSGLKKGLITVIYKTLTGPEVVILCVFLLLVSFDVTEYPQISAWIAGFLALYFRNRVYDFLLKHIDKTLARVYTLYFSFFVVLLVWTFIIVIKTNKANNYNIGGYMQTSNETINFDSKHWFLGRTRNYSFIFTPDDSCTRVINNSEVKDLFIKAN